jgi:hypothetical protein
MERSGNCSAPIRSQRRQTRGAMEGAHQYSRRTLHLDAAVARKLRETESPMFWHYRRAARLSSTLVQLRRNPDRRGVNGVSREESCSPRDVAGPSYEYRVIRPMREPNGSNQRDGDKPSTWQVNASLFSGRNPRIIELTVGHHFFLDFVSVPGSVASIRRQFRACPSSDRVRRSM